MSTKHNGAVQAAMILTAAVLAAVITAITGHHTSKPGGRYCRPAPAICRYASLGGAS
jgi:hypothetical protein